MSTRECRFIQIPLRIGIPLDPAADEIRLAPASRITQQGTLKVAWRLVLIRECGQILGM